MAESFFRDGIEYLKSNHRMVYNPEFHTNHGKKWTKEDLIYLCECWNTDEKRRDIALALGRTESTCMAKVSFLKKIKLFDYYAKKNKK
ncbi:hypothetical protein AAA294_07255 [Fusobacterium varium]|uniref:hypothetical protein n=1 Tax=Fusobacterium varium TaxID=856 RepID=UPI0032BF2590